MDEAAAGDVARKKRRRRKKKRIGDQTAIALRGPTQGFQPSALEEAVKILQAHGMVIPSITAPESQKPTQADLDREADERQRQFAKEAEEAGKAALAERLAQQDTLEPIARKMIDLCLLPRHKEAFDHVVAASGLTAGQYLQQILRGLAGGWRQTMLEDRGGGGGSTRKAQPTG